jgi:hydroxymethylpyrimidine pyrophosphatase-like HAD family hydrolase
MHLGKKELPVSLIFDIDGTLLKHRGTIQQMLDMEAEALPGVVQKLKRWRDDGHKIILITGRPGNSVNRTVEQLSKCDITYDRLIMDVGTGARVLFNDLREPSEGPTAAAVNLVRDSGLVDIELENIR